MHFDLHTHSKYSFDSKLELFQMFEAAKRAGLNGIAVTDHDSIQGGKHAKLMGDPQLKIIPGIEVHSAIGDIVGLFVEAPIEVKDPFEVVEAIHDQDGIAILPHPFRGRGKVPLGLFDKLDGIECYNARYFSQVAAHRQISTEHMINFAADHGLAVIGVSDAHTYQEIGRGSTVIPGITTEDIKRALRNRETSLGYQRASAKRSLFRAVNTVLFPKSEEPGRCIVRTPDFYETRSISSVDSQEDAAQWDEGDRMNPYRGHE